MQYISLREVLIRNTSGTHDQIIPAGVPTEVLPMLHAAAGAAGCVPYNEEMATLVAPAAPQAPVTPDKAGTQLEVDEESDASGGIGYTPAEVKAAVEALIARNNKMDFGATGRPKVAAVAKILGQKPTGVEIATAWDSIQDEVE